MRLGEVINKVCQKSFQGRVVEDLWRGGSGCEGRLTFQEGSDDKLCRRSVENDVVL